MYYLTLVVTVLFQSRHVHGAPALRIRPTIRIVEEHKSNIIRSPYMDKQILQIDFPGKKPICGPVPFPDFSCEEATTCRTVQKKSKGDVLHYQIETICDTAKPELITHRGASVKLVNTSNRSKKKFSKQFLQDVGGTTSTFAPFFGGTQPTSVLPGPELKCAQNSRCTKPRWHE